MKRIEIEVPRLLPIDFGTKSKFYVNLKKEHIINDRLIQILTIESVEFPGNFYVGDGHHGVLGYMELNKNPSVIVLEKDDDLREVVLKYSRKGAIDTTHLPTMRKRLHQLHLKAQKNGVENFYKLQELIV